MTLQPDALVQVDTMQQDLNASISLRKCTDSKLHSARNRADKAESELAAVHQANVDMNLRIIRLQAENAQLREDNQCAPRPSCACAWAAWLLINCTLAVEQLKLQQGLTEAAKLVQRYDCGTKHSAAGCWAPRECSGEHDAPLQRAGCEHHVDGGPDQGTGSAQC